MQNEHRDKSLRAVLGGIRDRGKTPAEQRMSEILIKNNVAYEWNKEFKTSTTIRMVDFFIEPNIVLECDGEIHFSPLRLTEDSIRTKELEDLGLMISRFTNDQILNNEQGIVTCLSYILPVK